MDLDPKSSDPRSIYRLLVACVVPRPIAWVTSLSADGLTNLAPFSFFMAHGSTPPIVSISVGPREGMGHEGRMEGDVSQFAAEKEKDTRRNVEQTGEFVVNVVTEELLDAVLVSARDYDRDVSEIEEAGMTRLPSLKVRPPRIAESPIQLECRLYKAVHLGIQEPGWAVLFGEIVHFHVADEILEEREEGYISPGFSPIGRCSGPVYCRTHDRISRKVTWGGVHQDGPGYLEKAKRPKTP